MSNEPLLSIEETLDRMAGDRELLSNLFQLFIDDAPKKLANIARHAAAGETFQVERNAHSLKGAAATVGASLLCARAAELEQAAKARSAERMEELRLEVEGICMQTLEEMERFVKGEQ